jgi:repressor LexA
MKGLTKRQREIVDYIQQFIANNRYSPSYREISQHFGFSSLGSVYKHINALKRKGAILAETQTSRSIAPAEQEPQSKLSEEVEIPFIGHISAGVPIQILSQTQQLSIPRTLVHSVEKTYALRVQGDSLSEEMIADGDLLLVEARQEAHPGETVVALINEHDTIVKKYYPEGNNIRLLSAYAHHHPILLRSEDIRIQGVLVGLLRLFG